MMESTKLYKGYQIVIPSKIRKELNIKENEIIEWKSDKNTRTITLSFRKKKSMMDLIGIISDEDLDALESCEKASKGEL